MKTNVLDDIFVLGIEKSTYDELLVIAKAKGLSVNDVTAAALRQAIADSKGVNESKTRKMLCEG
jgi:hypothetical protein